MTKTTKSPWVIDCLAKRAEDKFSCYPLHDRIGPLKRINIFVGPNNSGKSRLMRRILASVRENLHVPFNQDTKAAWNELTEIHELLDGINSEPTSAYISEQKQFIENIRIPLKNRNEDAGKLKEADSKLSITSDSPEEWNKIVARARNLARTLNMNRGYQDDNPMKLVYIPALRSFKSPETARDHFSRTAREHYFPGTSESNITIDCGGTMYDRIKEKLLGDRASRESVRRFEEFVSNRFLEGKGITIIPREKEKIIYVKIANELEQPIPNIGDGIQQIITILFSVFTERTPTILFLEEPELFLHPGFQTRLLQCFDREEMDHVQLFATTHSNHFVKLSIDRDNTQIFQVKKRCDPSVEDSIPSFETTLLSEDRSEVLSDLGVERASLLLSNCSIMVEGPTDRLYFQRFLDIYIRERKKTEKIFEFVPDLHYSFVEYGGANLVHWGFLDREGDMDYRRVLGEDVLVIVDKDLSESKEKRFLELCKSLDDRVFRLGVIEVENLIGASALQKIVAEYEGGKVPELQGISTECYSDVRLGNFIESKVTNSKRTSKDGHPYSDPRAAGAVKNKVSFCKKAMKYMNDRADISDHAWVLAEKIYDFVRSRNSFLVQK